MKRIFILMILYTQFLFAYEYAEGFDEAFMNSCTKALSQSTCMCKRRILKHNVPYQELGDFSREAINVLRNNNSYNGISQRYRKITQQINNCGR